MKLKELFSILPVFFAFACGGAVDGDEVHEKEGSDEDAILAGWDIQPTNLQSRHPLGDNLNQVVEVNAPDTARKFRLRFSTIRMERGYDFLVIKDEFGTELERVTGNHRGYVSRTINGNKAQVVLVTDAHVASWGFALDQIRHRGCQHNNPGALRLRSVAGCTALQDEIRTIAVAEVRRRFTDGHFGGPIFFRAAGAENTAQPAAAPAHSETNTQVRGVDEADSVKTDGNYTYQVAGRQLRRFRSWPAASTALVNSVDIEGFPKEIFIQQGKAVVLSGVQGDDFFIPGPGPGPIPLIERFFPIWWRPDAFTKVTVVRFDGNNPVVESEILLAGQYNTARRVGSSMRVLLQRELKWPNIQYYPEGNIDWNSRAFDDAMDQLEADAIRSVSNRALADWLPKSYRLVNGQRVALPIQCQDFFAPTGSDQIGLASVATVDLGQTVPSIQETSLLVEGQQVYQSLDNLYVASVHNWSCWEDAGEQGQFTYVHKLDVSRPERSTYLASGGFVGSVNDQFQLDEHNGYLRVAATNTRWNAQDPAQRSVNRVFVLGQNGRNLDIVGQTPDLAPGETIFGARFIAEKGFVVTYRQVDPLFTIDLSDPRNPRVAGELKVPGFSTYLHPLDSTHLFTIGQDFEPDGRTRNGVALSIFDVSNLAVPRLTHKAVIGTTNGYSDALYDHKAFTMYQQPGANDVVLAIPFTDYVDPTDQSFWGSFTSTLKVFRVSALGILGLGELNHSDLYVANQSKEWGWWYRPNISRGVFVDNYVYALSDAGLKVAEINNLANVVATVSAPAQWQNPTPVVTTINDEAARTVNASIPDNNRTGVSSTLELTKDLEIQSLIVDVRITHSYRGDLEVTVEHAGTVETLQNRTGGSSDDLIRTFVTERFHGQNAKGTWTLRVRDLAAGDVGTLVEWNVRATGTALDGGGSGPSPTIQRTFENTRAAAIPDNDARGISSVIDVPDALSIQTLELTIDIAHPYRGDLKVTLEHDGVVQTIHDRTGGSLDDLRTTISVDAFGGRDARGRWTLKVSDHAGSDVGTLNSWRLSIAGTQLGS